MLLCSSQVLYFCGPPNSVRFSFELKDTTCTSGIDLGRIHTPHFEFSMDASDFREKCNTRVELGLRRSGNAAVPRRLA